MTAATDLAGPDPLAAFAAEAGTLLRELAQIGMAMARDLGRFAGALAAAAPADAPPTPDQVRCAEGLMGAFGRVSRSVRQSLALQARLIADVAKVQDRAAAETARRAEAEAETLAARRLRGGLRRGMATEMAASAVESLEREPLETERLLDDLQALLTETFGETCDDADLAQIDIDTVALQLCADLGVDPGSDWWRSVWGMERQPRIRPRRPVPAQPPP